jgi:hypothetical protein
MTEQKATQHQPSHAKLLIWVALQNRGPPTLDTIMPNGKKLGDCTGTYCGQLNERLIRIGRGVETGQP